MPDRIIISKLKECRRLVVPRLGVFIVRDDGRVLFSELLRNDDGVLRSLLISERGVGEIEAAGVIDRFVFEVRHTIDHGKEFKIGSIGSLRRDKKGAIRFTPADETPADDIIAETPARPSFKPAFRPVRKPTAQSTEAERPAKTYEAADNAPSPSEPLYPEPTDADEYSAPDVRISERSAASEDDNGEQPQRWRMPKPSLGRFSLLRRADMFLVLAIVVILAAVGVIVYGYLVANERTELEDAALYMPDDAEGAEDASEPDLSVPSSARQ